MLALLPLDWAFVVGSVLFNVFVVYQLLKKARKVTAEANKENASSDSSSLKSPDQS